MPALGHTAVPAYEREVRNVRSTPPNCGHWCGVTGRLFRAKTGREQMQQKKLFDHPVGADQEGLGDGQPERLRGSKVDDEIELNGLFDWKIRRLRAAQNPINITGSASEQVGNIYPI